MTSLYCSVIWAPILNTFLRLLGIVICQMTPPAGDKKFWGENSDDSESVQPQ